jgi:hypothetical protein
VMRDSVLGLNKHGAKEMMDRTSRASTARR